MSSKRLLTAMIAVLVALGLASAPAIAQQVLNGDPIDPGTGLAYPILPGLPLLLPGPDGDFATADDIIDTQITGDTDIVVRVGTLGPGAIPPPAAAPGGAGVATLNAGGGSSGVGAEIPFTVLLSDGSGTPPYGNVVTAADLDFRGVTVYAFADLDGDGFVGPTNIDGSADNALERQEATGYVGRQVGQFSAGLHSGSLGIQLAAPASIGGLMVSLSAGAYTGIDPSVHFSDGPFIQTLWPYFPPLDPARVVGNGSAAPPDPNAPSELKFDPERNYLPAPDHPILGTPFAIPVDGSEPTTDQFVVYSGPASTARFAADIAAGDFRSISRVRLRPAPSSDGSTRVLVMPLEAISIAADAGTTRRSVRLLAVDLFGNVADPPAGGFSVDLVTSTGVKIVSPDSDADTSRETIVLVSAAGATVTIDDDGTSLNGRIDLLQGQRIMGSLPIHVGTGADRDEDGQDEDGNVSSIEGDLPCINADPTAGVCDDNCTGMVNPSQFDDNTNGLGNCCDGTCAIDPASSGCGECQLAGPPTAGLAFTRARVRVRRGSTSKPDRLLVRARFTLASGATIDPAAELVLLALLQNSVLHYGGVLNGVFTVNGHSGTRFRYKDSTAAVAGVTRAFFGSNNGSSYRLRWRAEGMSLLGLDTSPLNLDLTIGDDAFTGIMPCTASSKITRCKL